MYKCRNTTFWSLSTSSHIMSHEQMCKMQMAQSPKADKGTYLKIVSTVIDLRCSDFPPASVPEGSHVPQGGIQTPSWQHYLQERNTGNVSDPYRRMEKYTAESYSVLLSVRYCSSVEKLSHPNCILQDWKIPDYCDSMFCPWWNCLFHECCS